MLYVSQLLSLINAMTVAVYFLIQKEEIVEVILSWKDGSEHFDQIYS